MPILFWTFKNYLSDARKGRLKEFDINAYQENILKHLNQNNLNNVSLPELSFNKYLADRIQNVNAFSEIKAPNNTSINDQLTASGNHGLITELNAIFLPVPAPATGNILGINDMQARFTQTITDIQNDINNNIANLSAYGIAQNLDELKASAIASINHQTDTSKRNLETLLNDPAKNWETSLNATPEQFEQIKNQMLKTFDENANKVKEELQKSLNETIQQIREQADKQRKSHAVYEMIMKASEENMNKALEAIERRHPGASCTVGQNQNNLTLAGAGIEDFGPIIKTFTGRDITVNNGALSIQMPGYGNTYNSSVFDSRRRSDFKFLMEIAYSKYDKINIAVTHPLPDVQAKRAREAVIAALETGYPLENISVQHQGKKLKGNEIFENLFKEVKGTDERGNRIDKDYTQRLQAAIQIGQGKHSRKQAVDAQANRAAVSEYSQSPAAPRA